MMGKVMMICTYTAVECYLGISFSRSGSPYFRAVAIPTGRRDFNVSCLFVMNLHPCFQPDKLYYITLA